jgi:hypothetical protein
MKKRRGVKGLLSKYSSLYGSCPGRGLKNCAGGVDQDKCRIGISPGVPPEKSGPRLPEGNAALNPIGVVFRYLGAWLGDPAS